MMKMKKKKLADDSATDDDEQDTAGVAQVNNSSTASPIPMTIVADSSIQYNQSTQGKRKKNQTKELPSKKQKNK
jgi:hypothetical protein